MGILTGVSYVQMPTPEMTPNLPPPVEAGSAASAAGIRWTANKSIFDPPEPVDWWRTVKAQVTSLAVHGIALAILIYAAVRASEVVQQVADEKLKFDVIYLANNPGPGGGGGGSPKPAPPKKVELPKPKPQQLVAPTPVPTVPPPPSLNAPVMTQPNVLLSASGVSIGAIDVPAGGGGKGTGMGTGEGSGLGPGTGGGFGGGVYRPGNGVENPIRIREVKPQYTPEAMRAKIQGTVELEAIIGPDGKVTEVRVIRSLDKVFGLDEQARKAVLATPFIPCKKTGQPVACLVVFELQFTLR
jgi:periplasmic protein TonB